jgi:prolyl 4-hydroxylase
MRLCRIEVVSWKPRAFIYHHFLSEAEAEHIKQLAAPTVSRHKIAQE